MVEGAYQAFKRVLANRKNDKRVEIDDIVIFFLIERTIQSGKWLQRHDGKVLLRNTIYNEDKLPHITPHSLRHTFCTNYANAEWIQRHYSTLWDMHNIAMTLNYYAHVTFDSRNGRMKRLNKEKQQERLWLLSSTNEFDYLFTTTTAKTWGNMQKKRCYLSPLVKYWKHIE